jgi:membrane-associated protein
MELLVQLFDFILHIDVHLDAIIRDYGTWTYAILFLIIFAETGLVVTPLLPGDSLLFAAGTFAARGSLDPFVLFVLLSVAAVLGDAVNYSVGRYLAPRAQKGFRVIKQEYLDRAPFVAGIGAMSYRRFALFNVSGGIAWIASFVFLGYFFGNIPAVEENFTFVIFGIILVSIMPGIIEYLRHRLRAGSAVRS